MELLNRHIIEDDYARDFFETYSKPSNEQKTITKETTCLPTAISPIIVYDTNNSASQQATPDLDETLIDEIDMKDREEEGCTKNIYKEEQTLQNHQECQILGQDIFNIKSYLTRNRVATPLNPFFISKKGIFKAGILSAQVPGESKKERLHYIAFLLKVPKESTLVSFEFINGNEWITFNFEEEEDIKNCIEKHNNKYLNETFKMTYLKGLEEKEVIKHHKIQKETVEKICHNLKPSIL